MTLFFAKYGLVATPGKVQPDSCVAGQQSSEQKGSSVAFCRFPRKSPAAQLNQHLLALHTG